MSHRELTTLVAQLRARIDRHARSGAWAASGRPSPRAEAPSVALGQPARVIAAHDLIPAGQGEAAAPQASLPSLDSARHADRAATRLTMVRDELGDCTRCGLCKTRNHLVFGVGAPGTSLMFVGEGPGADEDRLGEPFVGKAGELLDKMIAAMGWTRHGVYIANVVKCRPPQNRTPLPEEVAACGPFLLAQIRAIAPRVIVALGRPAANFLLANDAPISTLRGRWHDAHGVRIMPTFHPAYLLRSPDRKRDAWHDLQLVMAECARLGVTPA